METETKTETNQPESVNAESVVYDTIYVSIDPGLTNMGCAIVAIEGNKLILLYSSTVALDMHGTGYRANTTSTVPQLSLDMVREWNHLLNVLQQFSTETIVFVCEFQYITPKTAHIGTSLKMIETAFMTLVRQRMSTKDHPDTQMLMVSAVPKTVNSALQLKGSKTDDPEIKYKFLVNNYELDNKTQRTFTRHVADAILQVIWHHEHSTGQKLPRKNISKTEEIIVNVPINAGPDGSAPEGTKAKKTRSRARKNKNAAASATGENGVLRSVEVKQAGVVADA